MDKYNNSCLSITSTPTADPFVIAAHGQYKYLFTAAKKVVIWSADSLIDISEHARRTVVWQAPPGTDHSVSTWAPELHLLQGRWYIYVTGANANTPGISRRLFVLGGPSGDIDPCAGPWTFLGRIENMNPAQWAIDGTVIILENKMYLIYSGWPEPNLPRPPKHQQLFIMKLDTPTKAGSEPVLLCKPEEEWECSRPWLVNEGPQYLESPDGSWKGIAYSCAGCWTNDYKMNTIRFLGGDPLDMRNWRKSRKPLLQYKPGRPPYGPGHGNFINLGGEVVSVFHASDFPKDVDPARKGKIQRVIFTPEGPYMGEFVGPLAKSLDEFVGDSDVHGGLRGLFHAPKG